ncbi:CDT1-like protein a, chloroplastic [Silene latifolia]|uniref:CDT1-like protein a, chloroplastic n=1 Tax=Silene latifolia TaxID=37657 RepID=UPI003D784F8A
MESSTTESSSLPSLIPFKSKKPLLTTPVKSQTIVGPSTATPDRVVDPPSRIRNQNFALSVSDVRRAAIQLRKSKPDNVGSGSGLVTQVRAPVGKVKRSEKSPVVLAEKYEMLCGFFDAMVSSIRLLRLKRLPTTFTKLSRNIESLTDRRFTLHHFAQLKHIMPEVIVVKKVRVQDEQTGCMKEELIISLETSAVETDKIAKGSGGYSDLKGFFHSRIVGFAKIHPETDDVPEGELPELFYKPKQEPEPSINQSSLLRPTTLTAPSFKRRFSSRALSTSIPESPLAKALPETLIKNERSFSTIDSDATPVKTASIPSKLDSTPAKSDLTLPKSASTPAEVVSTPARLMAATPALRTPKRSLITDDGLTGLPNLPAKRRALNFDIVEEKSRQDGDVEFDAHVHCSAASKDLLEVLPENLLHSLMEKERKTLEEQDPIVCQANKRQQLIAGVPKLFDMIRLLFQSIRRFVITKEELIHKIITGHMDIVDKREVEEQLELLQEIAPEFITEHSGLDGSTVIRLNKSSCAESIRAKLLEAN